MGFVTLAFAAGARPFLVDAGALIHYAPVRAVTPGESRLARSGNPPSAARRTDRV